MYLLKIIFLLFILTINFEITYSKDLNYFLMLKNNKANVRYGPSFEYPIKYVYIKKSLPIKVIDKKENFRKIIDHKKNSGWIHISQLKNVETQIILESVILFKKPTKFSEPIAKIKTGKILKVKKCIKNWCNVKVDNLSGWVQNNNAWGKVQ